MIPILRVWQHIRPLLCIFSVALTVVLASGPTLSASVTQLEKPTTPAKLPIPKPKTPAEKALAISSSGKAVATIVACSSDGRYNQLAVKELTGYLAEVTGGQFQIVEAGRETLTRSRIYVGSPALARLGVDVAKLQPDEWIVRTVGTDICLAGGSWHGTLFAVYHFLEDLVGIRWWTAYEEYVPQKPNLSIPAQNRRGQSPFRLRSVCADLTREKDFGLFMLRRRLLPSQTVGADGSTSEHGTISREPYGGPDTIFTLPLFVPPEDYKSHPEWFAQMDDKRVRGWDLCLTNEELQRTVADRVVVAIEDDRKRSAALGLPNPTIYNVSLADNTTCCRCSVCRKLAAEQGSESGLLITFVNSVADIVNIRYPGITIETLAYQEGKAPPKSIAPRDNVAVRYCAESANQCRPLTDPSNSEAAAQLKAWKKLTKNVAVLLYDNTLSVAEAYGVRSAQEVGPTPNLDCIATDCRFLKGLGVTDIRVRHEIDLFRDMADMKLWMWSKLVEDPSHNPNRLIVEFTNGYYGPAGQYVRSYLKALRAAESRGRGSIWMYSEPSERRYLDSTFLRQAEALFASAEKAVAGNAVFLRRVRFARLPVDRAVMYFWPELVQQWTAAGLTTSPVDRGEALRRWRSTVEEQAALRGYGSDWMEREMKIFDANDFSFRLLQTLNTSIRPSNVTQYWANNILFNVAEGSSATPMPDVDSPVGWAVRISGAGFKLPMTISLGNSWGEAKMLTTVAAREITGSGYKWYRLKQTRIEGNSFVFFTRSTDLRVFFSQVGMFEIWASLKFSQPPDDPAVYVDRVALARTSGSRGR